MTLNRSTPRSVRRTLTLPWLLLIAAAIAVLLSSGTLNAQQIGDRVFLWLLVAAGVAAAQTRERFKCGALSADVVSDSQKKE